MVSFRSQVTQKTLNFFFLNEDSRVYVNQLARQIDEDPKNVHRVLTQLETAGILTSHYQGKERYFSSDPKNPVYSQYRQLFMKTVGFRAMICQRLRQVDGIQEVYLYGSCVNGTYTASSDIDLLVIGSQKPLEAQRVLHHLQKELGREIEAIYLSPEEFRQKKMKKDDFIWSVFQKKTEKIL